MAKILNSARTKIARETRAKSDPGFPQMGEVHYLEWLKQQHDVHSFGLYFEIGTEGGASLALAKCPAIAVDPAFKLDSEALNHAAELHLFQTTSDAFFAGGFLERYGRAVDFAFLDGMHKVEFLLRDFMNVERHMSPGGTVTMHDCVPMSFPASERDWDKSKTRRWTGDVWKMVPILRAYRPDLEIRVLNLPPSGIVQVRNLDPDNSVLTEAYDEIVDKYVPLSLKGFGLEALVESLQLESVRKNVSAKVASPHRWEQTFEAKSGSLKIAIKTPRARTQNAGKIVDYSFARALANGLLNLGHAVRIDSGQNWYESTQGTDFDLLLRGRGGFEPQADIPYVMWVIYPGKQERHQITQEEVSSAAHSFFASELAYTRFRNAGNANTSVLMQGFDPSIMFPPKAENQKGTVFVGSNHFSKDGMRPIIRMALDAEHAIKIWGRGWRGTQAEASLQHTRLDNLKLGDCYRGARIVLCDHMRSMRESGYVSNRIYDALACGAAVISDDIQGLPDAFEADVFRCQSTKDFVEAVREIERESYETRAARHDRARKMHGQHSLFHRAAEISERLLELKKKGAS